MAQRIALNASVLVQGMLLTNGERVPIYATVTVGDQAVHKGVVPPARTMPIGGAAFKVEHGQTIHIRTRKLRRGETW